MGDEFSASIKRLFSNHLHEKVQQFILNNDLSFAIDLQEIDRFDPAITDLILSNPIDAMERFKTVLNDEMGTSKKEDAVIRFYDLPISAQAQIANLRIRSMGRLIQVAGLIQKVSNVAPSTISITYECPACGFDRLKVIQTENKRVPRICTACGKKSKEYAMVSQEMVDKQRIVITSTPQDESTRMEQIEVVAFRDLTDPNIDKTLLPGNRILVSGVLSTRDIMNSGGLASDKEMFLDASYIEVANKDFDSLELTQEEITQIKGLSQDPRIFSRLVDSFAPHLYDLSLPKEAILYQLFGGVTRMSGEKRMRGDINGLLVGDPAMGKSELLKFAVKVAPKSMYISGKTTSGPGLVGAAVTDKHKNWVVEVGALGLMSHGFLAVDELDQFPQDDYKVFNEALEHGEVTIQKAGKAKWSAEEPVLCAGNPKNERFDSFDTIASQITFPKTLLSRFDFIFILKDKPGEKDKEIFSKMMDPDKDLPKDAISTDMLRKYIAYAKRTCFPRLQSGCESLLNDFFYRTRTQYLNNNETLNNTIPVSNRLGESLRRIAEASARWRLSDTATEEDGQRAINITTEYLKQAGIDPTTGRLDTDRVLSGKTSDTRKAEVLIEAIRSKQVGGRSLKFEVYLEMEKLGIGRNEIDMLIEKINRPMVRIIEKADSIILL